MKLDEIIDKRIYVKDYFVGKVKDLYFNDAREITHLEVELTKQASKDLLGAKTSFRNTLAVSALGKWPECCTNNRINLGVSKGQLNIYLRPSK